MDRPVLVRRQLLGGGTATGTFLHPQDCDPPCQFFDGNSLLYDFEPNAAPVPEPASVLLVGSALLLGARRRRSR
jgi:hypothetical protein